MVSIQFGQFLVCCSSTHGAPVPYDEVSATERRCTLACTGDMYDSYEIEHAGVTLTEET